MSKRRKFSPEFKSQVVLLVLLAMAVIGSLGLGAVVSTRLGTRPVRRRYFVQG